jgi:hypothetical protein
MQVSAFNITGATFENVTATVSLLAGSEAAVAAGKMTATPLSCIVSVPESQTGGSGLTANCTSKGSVTLTATQFITIQIAVNNQFYFNNSNFLVRFVCR